MAMQSDTAVSAADREAAAARLREQYSAGRLTLDEFQERLDAVYRAQTPWDLGRVTTDLPLEGVVYGPGGPEAGGYLAGAADVRAALAQAGRRIALTFGLLMAGGFVVLALLITAFMVHGGLLGLVLAALLAIVAAGAAAVAGLAWMASRLWRRGAWLEAVPLLAGQPWLGRAARLAFTGHALWRLRARRRLRNG